MTYGKHLVSCAEPGVYYLVPAIRAFGDKIFRKAGREIKLLLDDSNIQKDEKVRAPGLDVWGHWVMVGRWRRWIVPGAASGAVAFIVLVVLLYVTSGFPSVHRAVNLCFHFFVIPLKMMIEYTFVGQYKFIYVHWGKVLFAWFVLFGASIGACVGVVYMQPQRTRMKKVRGVKGKG